MDSPPSAARSSAVEVVGIGVVVLVEAAAAAARAMEEAIKSFKSFKSFKSLLLLVVVLVVETTAAVAMVSVGFRFLSGDQTSSIVTNTPSDLRTTKKPEMMIT